MPMLHCCGVRRPLPSSLLSSRTVRIPLRRPTPAHSASTAHGNAIRRRVGANQEIVSCRVVVPDFFGSVNCSTPSQYLAMDSD